MNEGENEVESAPLMSPIDAEKSLLGALMHDPDTIFPYLDFHGFYKAYFVGRNHGRLYEILQEMRRLGQGIDGVTVVERVKALREWDKISGEFLSSLNDACPSSLYFRRYADIVREAYLRRCLKKVGFELQTGVVDVKKTGLQVVEAAVQRLAKVASGERREERKPIDAARRAIQNWRDVHHRRKKIVGLSTGMDGLDMFTGGLKKPNMFVIAARPSVGKTTLAMTIARNLSEIVADPDSREDDPSLRFKRIRGKHVGIVSMDSDLDELTMREMCNQAEVSGWKLDNGFANEGDFARLDAALPVIDALPFHILDDTREWSVISAWLRALKAAGKLDMVVIDYLQQIEVEGMRFFGVTERVTWVSGAIKALLRELGVPGIIIVQLNRDIEKAESNRPPKASDMRDSGAIEQDANQILMLWKDPDWVPLTDEERRQITAVRGELVKNKGGPKGTIPFCFYPAYYRFTVPPRLKVDPDTGMPLDETNSKDLLAINEYWVRYNRPKPREPEEREGGRRRRES